MRTVSQLCGAVGKTSLPGEDFRQVGLLSRGTGNDSTLFHHDPGRRMSLSSPFFPFLPAGNPL